MTSWTEFYATVAAHIRQLRDDGCDVPFFRGHADHTWSLKPALARGRRGKRQRETAESQIYYDFVSLSGPLIEHSESSWNTLFTMQHHGLPTRLLDWTLNLATAVYFAINDRTTPSDTACVWVLDPFALNKRTFSNSVILTPPQDFVGSYYESFITGERTFGHKAVAINPIRLNVRQVAQDSAFTFSGELKNSLNQLAPDAFRSFLLPKRDRSNAKEFLELAGINERRLFPDLDGISRHIRSRHWDLPAN